MKRQVMFAALALLVTSGAAQADECDIMAAKIAKSENLIVHPRTKGNFFPMSRDEYGAYLNCAGTYGMNLHSVSRLPASQEWNDVKIHAGSILTGASPTIISDGIQQCIKEASASKHQYADVTLEGARIWCDLTKYDDHEYVDLNIAK